MKHSRWLLMLLAVLCYIYLLPRPVYAAAPPTNPAVGPIGVFEDAAGSTTLAQLLAPGTQFIDLTTSVPNFGFTTSAYWLRIPVQNPVTKPTTYYLDIKNATLDYVMLYVVSAGQVITTIQAGDQMAASLRPYPATTLVLPFHLAAEGTATLYLRVYSVGAPLFVPFTVVDEATIQRSTAFGLALDSALLGLLAGLFVYNFFIFSLLRSRLYLYYVLFLPITYLATVGTGGFGPTYLYPGNTWLGNEGVGVFTGLTLTLMILITREFLQTRRYPWLDGIMYSLIVCGLGISVGVFLWPPRFGYQLTMVVLFLYPLVCLLAGIIAWHRGQTAARFYLIGQAASWCGMVVFAMLSTGLLPYHLLLYESPTLGVAGDALLLSLALADRIRLLQQARLAAEDQARRNLEIRSEELERLVVERTAEIKTLHGILPICANCKKIRTDDGAWQALETYLSQHTDAQFSHGICAECMQELYPEIQRKRQQKAA